MHRVGAILTGGWLLRIGLQAGYFVVIAHALGAADYGGFSAALAAVSLVSPFASLGAVTLVIRNIRLRPESAAGQFWGASRIALVSGSLLTVAVAVIGSMFLRHTGSGFLVLVLLGCADLIGMRVVEIAASCCLAVERAVSSALLPVYLSAARLAGALAMLALPVTVNVTTWATVYLLTTVPFAFGVVIWMWRQFGWQHPGDAQLRRQWLFGLQLSVSLASQTVYNDIDKAMLGHYSTLTATGIYSAAYRIIDVSCAPMRGLLAASYPRFFDHGTTGLGPALAFGRKVGRSAVLLGLLASVVVLATAGLVPVVLGRSFTAATQCLRLLSPLPLLKGVHYTAANTLTGADRQGPRTVAQVAVAVLNVLLNLVLIPRWSWHGAVWSSLICDGLLAVVLWTIVARLARREARAAAALPATQSSVGH